jgi:hypothetical protein
LIAVVVSVGMLFFRHHFTERLIAKVRARYGDGYLAGQFAAGR